MIRRIRREVAQAVELAEPDATNTTLFGLRDRIRGELEALRAGGGMERPTVARQRELRQALDEVTLALVDANMGLVWSQAARWLSRARNDRDHLREEIEAEGRLMLFELVDRFDLDRGVRFSSLAYRPIHRVITRVVHATLRPQLSAYDWEGRKEVLSTVDRLESVTGQTIADEQVAEVIGFEVERVRRIRQADGRPASLHATHGSDATLADALPDPTAEFEDGVAHRPMIERLLEQIASLPEAERTALLLHRGFAGREHHFGEIGEELGMSDEAARQKENAARSRLCHPIVLRQVLRQGS